MRELPADLAEPLHLLKPDPWATALGWLAALLLLTLLWMLYRRLRRRRAARPLPPVPPSPPVAAVSGIEKSIDEIRRRYSDADHRQGCHQLSAALREHYEETDRHRFSTLTVREVAAAIGDVALTRFLGLLADLQFGRREPSRDDFQGACELAVSVARSRRQRT